MSAHNDRPPSGEHPDNRDKQIIRPCRACGYVSAVRPEDRGYCERCAAGIRLHRAIVRNREAAQ